jgi:hypothetical protein
MKLITASSMPVMPTMRQARPPSHRSRSARSTPGVRRDRGFRGRDSRPCDQFSLATCLSAAAEGFGAEPSAARLVELGVGKPEQRTGIGARRAIALSLAAEPAAQPALPMPDAMPRRAAPPTRSRRRAPNSQLRPAPAALAPRNAPPAAKVAACPPWRMASMPPATERPARRPA